MPDDISYYELQRRPDAGGIAQFGSISGRINETTFRDEHPLEFQDYQVVGVTTTGQTIRSNILPVSRANPGSVVWARAILGTIPGGGKNVAIRSVAVDPNSGDVVVCGNYAQNNLASSSPKVDFGGGTALPYDCASGFGAFFIAKYTKNNALVWVKGVTEGTGFSLGFSVVVNSDGNIFTSGLLNGSMTIDGTTLSGASSDGFLIKFNSSGVIQNAQLIGGPGTDNAVALRLDGSGNPVLTGSFSGTTTFDGTHQLTATGGLDLYIAVYNKTDLTISLLKGFGGAGDERPTSLWYEASGAAAGIYITGFMSGICNFGGGSVTAQSPTDMFVVKYNLSGDWQWNVRVGLALTSGVTGNGICVDGSGRVLVTGSLGGNDGSTGQTGPKNVDFGNGVSMNGPETGNALFVAQYTSSGVCQWVKRYAGNTGASDSGRSLTTDSSGNIYITGNTTTSSYDSLFILGATPTFLMFKMSPAILSGGVWTPGTAQWMKGFLGNTGQICSCDYIFYEPSENKLYAGGNINGGCDMGAPVNGGTRNSFNGVYFPSNGILLRVNP